MAGRRSGNRLPSFSHHVSAFWSCPRDVQFLFLSAQSLFCGGQSLLSDVSAALPSAPSLSACRWKRNEEKVNLVENQRYRHEPSTVWLLMQWHASHLKYRSSCAASRFPKAPPASLMEPPPPPPLPAPLPSSPSWIKQRELSELICTCAAIIPRLSVGGQHIF